MKRMLRKILGSIRIERITYPAHYICIAPTKNGMSQVSGMVKSVYDRLEHSKDHIVISDARTL